jgi:hypothetical protein
MIIVIGRSKIYFFVGFCPFFDEYMKSRDEELPLFIFFC